MKQFKSYIGQQSNKITCINDAFGPSIAVFNLPYRPGDIARRNVEHRKTDFQLPKVDSHFRIIREVSKQEVEKLLVLAQCSLPARDGWWYEVIGD